MADFKEAHVILEKWEGGYVNNPNDKGGETLNGIARKFHPEWSGWDVVDKLKAHFKGDTKALKEHLKKDKELHERIESFYKKEYWDRMRLDEIKSFVVATKIYLFGVNAGINTAIKYAQQVANEVSNAGLVVDCKIGAKTIAALNKIDGDVFKEAFKAKERARYQSIVAKNPSQSVFLKGWLNRVEAV